MEKQLFFNTQFEFRLWLETHYSQKESVWLVFLKNKKNVFTHKQALEEALCFGWIDSVIKRIDENKYQIRFSPRRKKSPWSEINKKAVEILISSGKMANPGQAAIDEAKRNGNWYKENKPVFTKDLITNFRPVIQSQTKLVGAYDKLSRSQQQFFAYYYFDAKKEETKKKRLDRIIEHIESGKKLSDI